jgi:hypothetical protein
MCEVSECVGDVDAYPLQSVFRCSLRDPRAFSLVVCAARELLADVESYPCRSHV